MPGTNKTEKVELNQYLGGDHYKRDDYNADMLKIDNAFKDISEPIIPAIEGYSLSITTSSKINKIPLKITQNITGGPITVSRNGAAAKPLKLPNGEVVTELSNEVMFYDVYEETEAFIYAPKSGGIEFADKNNKVITKLSNSTGSYSINMQEDELEYTIKKTMPAGDENRPIYKVDPITGLIWMIMESSDNTQVYFYVVNPITMTPSKKGQRAMANFYSSFYDRSCFFINGVFIHYDGTNTRLGFTDVGSGISASTTWRSLEVNWDPRLIYNADGKLYSVSTSTGTNAVWEVNWISKTITKKALDIRSHWLTKNTYSGKAYSASPYGYFQIYDANFNYLSKYTTPYGAGDEGKCLYNPVVQRTMIVSSEYSEGQFASITLMDKVGNVISEADYDSSKRWSYGGGAEYHGEYFYMACEHNRHGIIKYDKDGNTIWTLDSGYSAVIQRDHRLVICNDCRTYGGHILQEASISSYSPLSDYGKGMILNTSASKVLNISADGDEVFEQVKSGDEIMWDGNLKIKPTDISSLEYLLKIK